MSDRRMLLQIVGAIQDAQEDNDNDDVSLLVAQFKDEIPNANVDILLQWTRSSYDTETLLDIALGYEDAQRKLTREELIHLVNNILHVPTPTEAEAILRVIAFDANCIHPEKNGLLFYPSQKMTVQEVVNLALNGVGGETHEKQP